MKKQNGITLISLIITIIIMLILAGVALSAVLSDNGIVNQAIEAKSKTEQAEIEEKRKLAKLEAATSFENREYIDTNGDKAIIPAGFAVINVKDENVIENGLVITDKNGNEFVWIPVDKNSFESSFVKAAGYADGSVQNISNYGEANKEGINSIVTGGEDQATIQEAIAMYASVKEHGGFYIGRYEAGKEEKTLDDGSTEIKTVVKKEAALYNNIKWGNSLTDTSDGAVKVARDFILTNKNATNKVHSNLCYSVQWDTALKFIDPTFTGYAKDSTNMGWFKENYDNTDNGNTDINLEHLTGKDLVYSNKPGVIANKHKNIYDLGGNAREWVMESAGTVYRCVRGGYYKGFGSARPASNRTNGSWLDQYEYIGFRIAMYID